MSQPSWTSFYLIAGLKLVTCLTGQNTATQLPAVYVKNLVYIASTADLETLKTRLSDVIASVMLFMPELDGD
jgi:hypothetical protein